MLKGLTLWEPYATAFVCGLKTVETRSWPTSYRGPLAIHAAVKRTNDLRATWIRAMSRPKDAEAFRHHGIKTFDDLPFGCIVGVGNLVACIPTSLHHVDTERRMIAVLGKEQWESDRQYGNFAPERFLWHIEEFDAFPTPIPYRGAQGLYSVEGITL